jgi:hypothetical protein
LPVIVMRRLRNGEWIYRDASSRQFKDHDLLVRHSHMRARPPSDPRRMREVAPALPPRRHPVRSAPTRSGRGCGRARVLAIDPSSFPRRPSAAWAGSRAPLQEEDDALAGGTW